MARGSQPKYMAIYAELRARILDGRLAPSSRLPAQQDLAAEFGVTLMTLRQAVGELEAEGLIRVAQGRGSFVVDQPLRYQVGNLTSFAQQVRGQGLELETEVIGIGPVSSHPEGHAAEAAAALGEGFESLIEVERLRMVGGRAAVFQRTVMAASLAEQLDLEHLGEVSLYEAIVSTAGCRVDRATERLRAVVLDGAEAGRLEQAPGSAAMLSIRVSLTADNTAFLFDRALLVGEAAAVEADRTHERLSMRYLA